MPNKKAAAMNRSLLDDDALEEILKRLPVKSLLRFKSACKSWHSLICSPYFGRSHLHCQSQTSEQALLVKQVESPPDDPFRLLGYCDGLAFGFQKPYGILWNPATRQCIHSLEWPESYRFLRSPSNCISGLVHHDSDYKAVLAYSYYGFVQKRFGRYVTKACVLSMKSRTWIMVDCRYVIGHGGKAVDFNGRLHWLVKSYENSPSSRIIYFDMRDFKFQELMQPDYHHNMDRLNVTNELGSFRGKLCFSCCGRGNDGGDYTCTVWMMNAYGVNKESWAKLFVVPLESRFSEYSFQPRSIIPRNDKLVLIGMLDYDHGSQDIRIVFIDLEENNSDAKITVIARWMVEPIHCIDYTPSLLWIDTASSDREGLPPPVALVPVEEFIPKTGSNARYLQTTH